VHGAGAALADSTAIFGSVEVEYVAEHPEQGHIRRHVYRGRPPIYVELIGHGNLLRISSRVHHVEKDGGMRKWADLYGFSGGVRVARQCSFRETKSLCISCRMVSQYGRSQATARDPSRLSVSSPTAAAEHLSSEVLRVSELTGRP
jgi:hypothetical protein